jgi:hypothetical protein
MAKNKDNSFKNNASSSSKNNTSSSNKNNAGGGSMKDTHAQVPDKGSSRSGPGGE